MNSRVRVILVAMMIVLLALVSAISVIPARADDGAPPPPAAPSGPAAEVTTAAAPTVLSQVPAGTDVVVVNDRGHKVSLATQEAAKIVASGDPVWCPTGVVPGAATCSPSGNTSFQNLINWMAGQFTGKAGTIWVESSYDNTVGDPTSFSFTLDGTTPKLTVFAPYALTINGGWNGTGTGMNSLAPSVFDGASLEFSIGKTRSR